MANLLDLALITGHKSISDMSDEELHEHLQAIRQSRRTPKGPPKATKAASKPKGTPAHKAPELPDIDNLSPEQAAALLAKIQGGA